MRSLKASYVRFCFKSLLSAMFNSYISERSLSFPFGHAFEASGLLLCLPPREDPLFRKAEATLSVSPFLPSSPSSTSGTMRRRHVKKPPSDSVTRDGKTKTSCEEEKQNETSLKQKRKIIFDKILGIDVKLKICHYSDSVSQFGTEFQLTHLTRLLALARLLD